MNKYLFQVKVSKPMIDFITEDKKKLGIKTQRQYFIYLLEKVGYQTNHKDI